MDDIVLFSPKCIHMQALSFSYEVITGRAKTQFYLHFQQNIVELQMIRNSTKKYKEKYAHSSVKKLPTMSEGRDCQQSSQRSIRFNTTTFLSNIKSTPKLQKSSRNLFKTQPLIVKQQSKNSDEKYSVFTEHTSIETIYTIMKKKGIDENDIERLRSGKLKKVNRIKFEHRDAESFIDNLPKNTLFFCCECFQYVFDIEKNRHFPDCKDQLNMMDRTNSQLAIKKIEKVVKLAEYTETKAELVKELYSEYVKGTCKRLATLEYPPFKFYTLEQIVYAFAYIYDQLLKNVKYVDDQSYLSCF